MGTREARPSWQREGLGAPPLPLGCVTKAYQSKMLGPPRGCLYFFSRFETYVGGGKAKSSLQREGLRGSSLPLGCVTKDNETQMLPARRVFFLEELEPLQCV